MYAILKHVRRGDTADTRDIMTKRSSVMYGMRDDDVLKAVRRFNLGQA